MGEKIMTVNYAHRGASGYCPENTMIAFETAIEMGCTGIETDVQMTKDGVLVLIHDEMVNRTTDSIGFVKDYTYNEINKLDAGSWYGREFKDTRIPTVEEFLLLASGNKIVVNFEIKSEIIQYDGIEKKLIDLIYKYKMQNRVIISSFNHCSAVKCKEISGEIKTGLLYMEGLYKPQKYAKFVGADALHPHFYTLNAKLINEIKKDKIAINTFTINDTNYMKYFVELEVDGIITNYPDKLRKIIEKYRTN
jgi:glycerophosphoryl diester phosphodiesterase